MAKKPEVTIKSKCEMVPMTEGATTSPNILFKGEKPKAGCVLTFTAENGTTYRGEVNEAVSVGDEVVVDFKGPITPVPKEPN